MSAVDLDDVLSDPNALARMVLRVDGEDAARPDQEVVDVAVALPDRDGVQDLAAAVGDLPLEFDEDGVGQAVQGGVGDLADDVGTPPG